MACIDRFYRAVFVAFANGFLADVVSDQMFLTRGFAWTVDRTGAHGGIIASSEFAFEQMRM